MPPLLTQVVERIDMLYNRDNPNDVTGVPTGYADLDRMTSGLQPGDLVIVAGRPSMGKTSLAMNIAEHIALHSGLPVGIFSMEMASTQLVMRMLGSVGKLDQHRLRTGRLQDQDWQRLTEAVGKLNDAPIHIDETAALNPLELRARARRLHRQYKQLGLIVVDYLQLMSASSEGENRATELSEISRAMKGLAKELGCPVVALSQLNRSLEQRPNKRPVMSDLRESGALEQDADLILFIYRDEVYNPESADKGIAEVIIGKQRNGPIGTVRLAFLGEFTRFENLADPTRY
jgi:replicative DNA helicase